MKVLAIRDMSDEGKRGPRYTRQALQVLHTMSLREQSELSELLELRAVAKDYLEERGYPRGSVRALTWLWAWPRADCAASDEGQEVEKSEVKHE